MKKNYEKEIKKLYESYSFIEEDYSKFKEIVLDSVSNNLEKDEIIEELKKNIINYIINVINDNSLLNIFEKTVNKFGIENSFSLYDMILKESNIEVSIDDIMALASNNKYEEYYKKTIDNKKIINNILLADVVEAYKSLKTEAPVIDETLINTLSDDHVRDYLLYISQISVLTREEERELIKKYRETKNEMYKDEFIEHNLRLAFSMALDCMKQRTGLKIGLMDLVQEANIGLMIAFDKFDENSEYKFSTYATWWIRQKVLRAIKNQNDTIRIPVHVATILSRKNKFIHEYINNNSKNPTDEEIMDYLEITKTEYKRLLEAEEIKRTTSIDINIEQDNIKENREINLSSILKDEESSQLEDNIIDSIFGQQLLDFTNQVLTEREAEIIRKRCGFNIYNEEQTLQEIGDELGLTRERIRQIENTAIEKLHKKSYLITPQEDTINLNTVILSKEDLLKKLINKDMNNIQIIEYRKIKGKSIFRCLNCDKNFTESPIDLLRRGACPYCAEKEKTLLKK